MRLLVLPHVKVHNANALSSPYTIGFPAMTAWLGFTHAIERKLVEIGLTDFMVQSTGVVSHQFDLQTFKGEGDYVSSIVGTGNPLDKTGNRAAFIEEARCHLEVTLVMEIIGNEDEIEASEFIDKLMAILATKKIAGGDILNFAQPYFKMIDENKPQELAQFTRRLMPGYVITERRDLMVEAMEYGEDVLDALLSYLAVHHSCEQIVEGDDAKGKWNSQRRTSGWIVPIATGFQGLSELGNAKNQRDPEVPHRFAESIVTLGEFVMAHKIKNIDDMLWHYFPDLENDLYLCQQNN